MSHLSAADVFVGWAAGCVGWQVALGVRRRVHYGAAWVMRVTAIIFVLCGLSAAVVFDDWSIGRTALVLAVLLVLIIALALSIIEHVRLRHQSRQSDAAVDALVEVDVEPMHARTPADQLDAAAALIGVVAVVVGAVASGGNEVLALARAVIGAAALGGLTFAMIFGHRLLAKPYLGRRHLEMAVTGLVVVWPLELVVMMVPTGMLSVLSGSVDDGYSGILGWMWAMFAVGTAVLLIVSKVILADREHSSLASATGMLYLAALTGAGAAVISRVVLSA